MPPKTELIDFCNHILLLLQIALGNVVTAWMKSGEGSVFVDADRHAVIGKN